MGDISVREYLKRLATVTPSQRQLNWYKNKFYAFVHFSPNTYTNLEWGTGKEDEKIFNPKKIDCDQWVDAIKSAGMTGMVLTAKHHDGFCLWNTKYTEHCVRNSPDCPDIVKLASDACRRGGIKFGFYLSPWDRNSNLYGTPAYNDYYINQLTELLTDYGEIFHTWFDNACGEGPNGIKQVYDFPRINATIRKYQPHATIFNDYGPDVRWCGNEGGNVRREEWAVVPGELCYRAEGGGIGVEPPLEGGLDGIFNWDENLGGLNKIMYSKRPVFCPGEVDMSIRPGWFYHPNEEPHSLERLFNTYINTVGGNCCFILNIPPNRDGLFDDKDVKRLAELGAKIKHEFSNPIKPVAIRKLPVEGETKLITEYEFAEEQRFAYAVLAEDLIFGQRISDFKLYRYSSEEQKFTVAYDGATIGNKKICRIDSRTKTFRIVIDAARDIPMLKEPVFYGLPE